MVLWENENFSNIQSTLFLHQREVVPSSYFTVLNFENNVRINVFNTGHIPRATNQHWGYSYGKNQQLNEHVNKIIRNPHFCALPYVK